MFTGLIEDIGTVRSIQGGATTRLVIESALAAQEITLGESIAIDGCCLTVVEHRDQTLAFDASAETLRRTTLGSYAPGDRVNLERAMALGERLGGHLVLGHVDATAAVTRTWSEGGTLWIEVGLPAELAAFFIEKGSVGLDGVSLTVNTLSEQSFAVTLIPETLARTTLSHKRVGSRVNLEADLIGKYVARMMAVRPGARLSAEVIERAGFRRQT